jgi:uracil-DNA glycosylase
MWSSINPIAVTSAAEDARELMAFYLDAGVDSAVGEEPVNHFADRPEPITSPLATPGTADRAGKSTQPFRGTPPSPTSSKGTGKGIPDIPRTPAAAPVVSSEAAVMAAREAARNAQSLDELRALLDNFEGCMLRATATQLVFAAGNPGARVMFVGEAPGRDEDIAGEPFVGRSGKLLDLMLQAIGLDRTKAYIANVVPWRPPGNRTPTPHETAICLPFIRRQIELANPDFLVCLGQPSTQTLLGTREGITRTRGRWFKFDTGTREIRATATYHPAFLLRSPLQKRLVWRDFLALKRALTG